jgi:hypothetical protein
MVKSLHNLAKPLAIRKLWLLSALGLATTIFVLITATKKESLAFIGNFETGDFSGWNLEDLCCQHSAQIVSSPTRAGNYAAKFTLNRNDPIVSKGKRAELKRYRESYMGSEHWYGLSIYLPNDWVEDTAPDIVVQWHDRHDFWLGETGKPPSFGLSINGKDWRISNTWDPNLVTKKNNVVGKESLYSGAFKRGVWTDWVFHIKWSHEADGIIEVWKDGTRIVNKRGPNTYNDLLDPYLKIGSYKYTWKGNIVPSTANKRVIYFDEVRIGNASASYKDVAPRSQSALSPSL